MKMKSALLVAVLTVLSQGAFAEPRAADQPPAQVQPPTQEQIQKGIVVLLEEGVIEWVDGRFVLRDQTALERLRQRGRVDLQAVADHVICY